MILLKQAARGMWRGRKSYIACVVLMAIGIMVFVSFNLMYRNLAAAMGDMYSVQRFGDAFATVGAIPLGKVDALAGLKGVARADATLVTDARVQLPGNTRIITLRVSSFIPGDDSRLNDFIVVEGAEPGDDGILVGEVFAATHGLEIGGTLPLVIEGHRVDPVITGTVQSPEYVYAIPDTGQLMPDTEAFGFGYLTAARLGALTGKAGTATCVSFLLEDGVTFGTIKPQLEDALSPYGLRTLSARKDQPSHAMLDQEIESIGSMASSLPMVFILMAVIILYIMLKRIIEQERMQIGTLKAFGFSQRTILLHYLGYGAITGLAGGVGGVGLGLAMTGGLTEVYLQFFSLPAADTAPDPRFLAGGMVIALGSGLLGAAMGARGILRLSPGEAMRPAAPPPVTGDRVGRIPLLRRMLSSYGFMSVRNITRNKFRSAFVVLGVAFSFALTAFMSSFGEMFDILMLNQFTKVELYNVKISLRRPAPYTAALESARALEGTRRVEGMLELPVELRREHLRQSLSITAIQPDAALYRVYDNGGDFTVPPPSGGVVISSRLAEDLAAKRGDVLTMRTPYTGDDDIPLPVLGVVSSNLGSTAYIQLPSLWELLSIPPTVSAVLVDAADTAAVKSALLDGENVAAITDAEESEKLYMDMLDSYAYLINLMQLAGVAIAFAIITNTATISLSERSREYATMRVLGMYPGEIGRVVGFEYWVLLLVSIPPGILFTRLIKEAMAGMISNDIFSMPVRTAPQSYATAAVLCMVAVALSNLSARRKISRFDMVDVLKERE